MDITEYVVESDGAVSFDEQQAGDFAKGIAGDFNPLHDPGSKRFCVPGDLLFSVLLHRYGVSRSTSVRFSGMLDGKTRMLMPDTIDGSADIEDAGGRPLLSLALGGRRITSADFIACLSEQYVRFSGRTFPDLLVPLMKSAGVMINPARPMVIYRDMSIELNDDALALFRPAINDNDPLTELTDPLGDTLSLDIASTDIQVDGRKGSVQLRFSITVGGTVIGSGEKNMLLSGLRDYDEAAMQAVIDQYNDWRQSYQAEEHAV